MDGCKTTMPIMNTRTMVSLLAILVVPLIATANDPVTVTLEPTRNNTIFSEATNSNGKGSYLFVGRTNAGGLRRALVYFDVSREIPEDAMIQSATLRLRMNRTITGAASISVHRLDRDWGEGDSNAFGEEGMGAPAQAGDATWNNAIHPDTAWSTSGGDFQTGASATTSVSGIGQYEWSSATLASDVQAWIDDPASELGWILIGPETATSAKRFESRHSGVATNRPQLIVTYIQEVDEPDPVPSFWLESPEVTEGWRYSGEGYDDIAGIGWIYDPHFPWIFTFGHGDDSGDWVYIVTEHGDYQQFWGYHANEGYWLRGDAVEGAYYSFAMGDEGWKPYRL